VDFGFSVEPKLHVILLGLYGRSGIRVIRFLSYVGLRQLPTIRYTVATAFRYLWSRTSIQGHLRCTNQCFRGDALAVKPHAKKPMNVLESTGSGLNREICGGLGDRHKF